MYLFRVSYTFQITGRGLSLITKNNGNYVPVGTYITIVRPDNSEIETKIVGIDFGSPHNITVESLKKEDVPVGSEVWANTSITYDLKHYNLKEKISDGSTYKVIFQHKIDSEFLMILTLSGFTQVVDHLAEDKIPMKLKIEKNNGSLRNEPFTKALVFADENCTSMLFSGEGNEILYSGVRQHN